MKNSSVAVPVLALVLGISTACGEIEPTAVGEGGAGEASLALAPGQLTAGQIPETGVLRGEIPNSFVCGIEVTTTVFDAGAKWPAPPGPPDREAGMNLLVWTNELNGQWIASRVGGQVTREIVEFFPNGSFLVHEVFSHGVQLFTASGPASALSAGHLVQEFTVVPLQGGGFELTNLQVLFVAGPRDNANFLESPAFCAIVESALL